MKKIVVTGPHCCGKSTIIKRIKEEFGNIPNIEFVNFSGKNSPVDYSNANKLKDNYISEIDITYYMITKLLEREIEIEYGKNEIAILDRCLIDQIVYPSVLLKQEYHKNIFDFLNLWIKIHPYEKIFYVPKNYELLSKYGTKDKSIKYLDDIEEKYLEIINKLGIDYTILPKNQEEQIKKIKKYLKEEINKKI